uniref:Protein SDA1 n=1 Tax=Gongylonema pulchrum TaxID=637853 RepID=A0A183DTP5_9BILA
LKAQHREVMRFLCDRLCSLNAVGLARITRNTFFQIFQNTLQDDDKDMREEAMRKLRFLLENCCPHLRSTMLKMENFRVITDAFIYGQSEIFALFLNYLEPEELRLTREYIDRIYDRKKTEATRQQRKILLRRQQTFQ